MSQANKIALIKEMLTSAEASLRSAQQMLSEIAGGDISVKNNYADVASRTVTGSAEGGKVVEGIFDGEKMIDPKGKDYPVPANYASKSKLVEGDHLKLTITDDGRFLYKQIGPVPRKTLIGPLTYEDGKYKVLAGGKAYNVLLASVTFYHAEVGDNVTIIVPEGTDSDWGSIDNVLPKNFSEDDLNDDESENDDDNDFDVSENDLDIDEEEEEEEKPKKGKKK